MTLQDLLDRAEIEEMLARYCHALDQKRWEEVRSLFTDDARLDYSAFGGPVGDADEMIAFVRPVVEGLASTQHITTTATIRIIGDAATVRSAALVPMTGATPDGGTQTRIIGLWYEDEFQRTPAGWRIAARRQAPGWTADLPAMSG